MWPKGVRLGWGDSSLNRNEAMQGWIVLGQFFLALLGCAPLVRPQSVRKEGYRTRTPCYCQLYHHSGLDFKAQGGSLLAHPGSPSITICLLDHRPCT